MTLYGFTAPPGVVVKQVEFEGELIPVYDDDLSDGPDRPWWAMGYLHYCRSWWRIHALLPIKRNVHRYGR